MALNIDQVKEVYVLSVHNEEEPLHISFPGVTPGRYDIPSINATKTELDACAFSFPGVAKPVRYANRRTLNHRPYVLIRICESRTFIMGTEKQEVDEYGKKLVPDIQRVPIPLREELVANEIERQCGHMGIKAIVGPPTAEDLDEVEHRYIEFMKRTVADTTRLAKKSSLNVTPQSVRRAWHLHKMGLLNPLPSWAEINPDATSGAVDMFNCTNCGAQLRKGVAQCNKCPAIYNWKLAVDLGIKTPLEVPPSKRAEAGLDPSGAFLPVPQPSATKLTTPDEQAKVADDDGDDPFESLNATDLPPGAPVKPRTKNQLARPTPPPAPPEGETQDGDDEGDEAETE